MAELTLLSEVQAPSLINFNTNDVIAEIIDRIQRHPEWNELWNGELKQSALYVIINIFAYLFSKNAEVANRLIRENFILLARDPNNIATLMSNYGLRVRSNTHSIANINVTRTDGAVLTSDVVLPSSPGAPFSITTSGTVGGSINFEIYEKDANGKIDYFKRIFLRAGYANNLTAYSGTTSFETVELDSQEKKEKFIYRLKSFPVIEDSIKIYYSYNNTRLELVETESFSLPSAGDTQRFPGGQPFYKLSYNANGEATIIFGTEFFGGSFPRNEEGELEIYYRVGGGANTNVANGSINYTSIVSDISFTFTNNGNSGGGVNIEDFDLAKFYAPMRVGRGKQIVDEKDSLLALAGMAVKHKVLSPQYSILPNKNSVPILHYFNYIVPNRDFTNFIFPTPSADDTPESYELIMRAALNDFLNLSKLHDGLVLNEVISDQYIETNIQYSLKYKPILSGTLTVSAYDYYDDEIDRLIYSSSYFGDVNLNDSNTSTAKIKSYARITDNVFNLNGRNQFDFEMNGYLLQITIPDQINGINIQYNSPSSLAETINNLIIQTIKNSWTTAQPLLLIPVGQNYITLTYNYFYYENNYFILNSPTIGANSSLKIIIDDTETIRNRFLALIKFTGNDNAIRFTYAIPESRKIFLDNSNFNYVNNSLEIKLNLDNINITKTNSTVGIPSLSLPDIEWPNRNSNIGPKLSYAIRDENLKNIFLKQNTDLSLEVYDSFGVLKDRVLYEGVAPQQITPGFRQTVDRNGNVIANQNEIFKDAATNNANVYTDTYFDYENSTLYFALENSDDQQTSAPYSFPREPFVNSFFENSISDQWTQYDDGIEATLPIDGFGKKFNFVAKNFIIYPSPDPVTQELEFPTGWQYYFDTYTQTTTNTQEQENPNPSSWYYSTISYEQKTLVPRVDENGDPVLDGNGVQYIDEVWLPYSTTNYLKTQYDIIVLDTANYRNIVIGVLIKPLIQVPVEVTNTLPSATIIDGVGNASSATNKISLIKFSVIENNNPNYKYLFEKKEINCLGLGISYAFQIDPENTNSQLKIKFDYSIFSDLNYISEYNSADIKIYIIAEDVNNTVVFQDFGMVTTSNSFEASWNSINTRNYKLAFHIVNANVNKYKLLIDNIQIYQEPIDTVYLLEILTDSGTGISLYKPSLNINTQTVKGQGVAYDFSLPINNSVDLNFQYAVANGIYNDILAVSVLGVNLTNGTYTLLSLNDNYDNSNVTVQQYTMNSVNNNNNKVSLSFNSGNFTRFRVVFHAKMNQAQTFQFNISNITIGSKPNNIYDESYTFRLDFSREKFNSIKCTYEPHPYFQEDESMGFLDILKNQNKRVIGVEPLLKKVYFNPMGISLTLTFSPVADVEEVLDGVENVIIDNFSYNNTNNNIKIGEIFSLDLIAQQLIQTYINKGLVGARVTDVNSLVVESVSEDDYYFVAPTFLYEQLQILEASYPNIVGIADKYNIKISYVKL